MKQINNTIKQNNVENKIANEFAFASLDKKNTRLNIMIIAAAVGLVACVISLSLSKDNMPGEVVGIISTVCGIFGSCIKDAYSFEFGSSRGSKDKDARLVATILEKR